MSDATPKISFSVSHPRAYWGIIVSASILGVLTVITLGAAVLFEVVYADKILPGVHVGSINLAGLSADEAVAKLEKNATDTATINFSGNGKTVGVNTIVAASDPDLSRPIVTFDWNKTAHQAFEVGRQDNPVVNLITQVGVAVTGKRIDPIYNFDRYELISILRTNFAEFEKIPRNASVIFNGSVATVTPEINGSTFDYDIAAQTTEEQIRTLNFGTVQLHLQSYTADVTTADAQSSIGTANQTLALAPLTIQGAGKRYTVDENTFKTWLEFQRQDGAIVIGVHKQTVEAYLETIAREIDVAAQDARFELTGENKVRLITSSQDGLEVDREASYSVINTAVIAGNKAPIELAIKTTLAQVADADLQELGVKELIGRGTSNFTGSPKNRRHNIATGANALNGLLIKPNEEFSLLDVLGEIDGENGYLQELVIKGNRTVPEYGGGLCQIGSTTFRAALRSGLPITERRNHSYRVVYYEPAGMDATIYDPAPDFKFLNDTGHHILFITKMNGDDLVFEFYGTKDGREVTITPDPPRIYNVTSPGPARYIETTSLKPGEKKRVEIAHAGADTYFEYIVKYPNGEVKRQEFTSHYIPWPEVWQVGVAATSTEPVVDGTVPADSGTPAGPAE